MFWNMLMRRSGRSRGGAQDGVRGQTDLNGGERKALAGVGIVFVKVLPAAPARTAGFDSIARSEIETLTSDACQPVTTHFFRHSDTIC